MFEPLTFTMLASGLMAASSPLVTAYVICLIIGGGLLVISTVFGGDSGGDVDADVDVDFGGDVDVEVEVGGDVDLDGAADGAGALALAEWFSVRFVVYFAAVFGMIGTVLTYMSELRPNVVGLVAAAGGLVVGQGVHQLFRFLRKTSGNSRTTVADYANKAARVTIAIAPSERGEVSVSVRGRVRYLPAVARRGDEPFKSGDQVVIRGIKGGVAEVISRREYELVTESEPG